MGDPTTLLVASNVVLSLQTALACLKAIVIAGNGIIVFLSRGKVGYAKIPVVDIKLRIDRRDRGEDEDDTPKKLGRSEDYRQSIEAMGEQVRHICCAQCKHVPHAVLL